MSSINDISNSDETLNSETVPTSNIDRSDKYKYNPQSAAAAAPKAVPRPDKPDNRKSGPTNVPKGGAGGHNWGDNAIDDQLSSYAGTDTKVPAESVLEPESEAEEKHARSEAANPNSDAMTLDEYEKQGHKV
ncbi:TPA: hypothetical protein ACH3X2_013107 [Trebouxia sp. C0005]